MLQLGEGEGEGMTSWWERGWGRERRTGKLKKVGKNMKKTGRVKSREGIKLLRGQKEEGSKTDAQIFVVNRTKS